MAITCTNRGTAASNASSATTYTFSPSGNFAATSLAVLCVSADNSITGGATNNITSITDSIGNTWAFAQKPIFDNGAASAGIQGALAYIVKQISPLQTGTTITVTFADAVTAKSYTLHEVVPTSGSSAYHVKSGVATGQSGTTAPTMTTGTIAVGNLCIASFPMESGTTQTFTDDADATNGTWAASQYSEVGSLTSGNCIGTQYKVQTTTGSTQTYNPGLGAVADTVGMWAEFSEVPLLLSTDTQTWPAPTRKRQAGFIEYGQTLLLTTLAVVAATNVPRDPLYTPIKTAHRIQAEVGPNLLMSTLGGSADVTIALSGTAVTVSAGTITASTNADLARAPLYTPVKSAHRIQHEVAPNLLETTLSGSAPVSVALSGQAVTASAGTLGVTVDVPLVGQAVTASAGTLAATAVNPPRLADVPANPVRSRRAIQPTDVQNLLGTTLYSVSGTAALSGTAVTASAGTLGVTLDVPLAGQAVTASPGAVGPDSSIATAGTEVTASAGTLGPDASIALVGTAVAADAGTLEPSASVDLVGQPVTVSDGTLTAAAETTVQRAPLFTPYRALRTVQPTEPLNLLGTTLYSASSSPTLIGTEVTASAGTLSVSVDVPLSGQAVTASAGTITGSQDYTASLTGEAVTVSDGTLSPSSSIALTGQAVTPSAGTATCTSDVSLGGTGVAASAGTAAADLSVALSGESVTVSAGTLTAVTSTFVRAVEFIATPGQTLTALLFDVGSDAIVDTAITVVESPNRQMMYQASFGSAPDGLHQVVAYAAGVPVATWYVLLKATAETVYRSGNYADIVLAESVELMRALVQNKTVTNPITGKLEVYADDSVTPLVSGDLYESTAETQKYRGRGAEVRKRLE